MFRSQGYDYPITSRMLCAGGEKGDDLTMSAVFSCHVIRQGRVSGGQRGPAHHDQGRGGGPGGGGQLGRGLRPPRPPWGLHQCGDVQVRGGDSVVFTSHHSTLSTELQERLSLSPVLTNREQISAVPAALGTRCFLLPAVSWSR